MSGEEEEEAVVPPRATALPLCCSFFPAVAEQVGFVVEEAGVLELVVGPQKFMWSRDTNS